MTDTATTGIHAVPRKQRAKTTRRLEVQSDAVAWEQGGQQRNARRRTLPGLATCGETVLVRAVHHQVASAAQEKEMPSLAGESSVGVLETVSPNNASKIAAGEVENE